jgi:hypothetical protein
MGRVLEYLFLPVDVGIDQRVAATPELLQFLRKKLGIQKVWVSNRANGK